MVTPRRTCLLRVPTLPAFQQIIERAIVEAGATPSADAAVLVPTRAAAAQLRRTLARGGPIAERAAAVPLLTREEWHRQLHARLGTAPRLLSAIEREGLMHAAARDAGATGAAPPFRLRPGLIGAMLAFYDEIRQNGRSVDAFERLMVDDLEASAEADRGARRLLRQTRFLVAAFRAYDARVEASGRFDEHRLRRRLIDGAIERPVTDLIVTVADSVAQPGGLHPADFDLFARLPGLARVTLIVTDAVLDCGYAERLEGLLPGIDHARPVVDGGRPTLVIPAESDTRSHFVWRDREEELRGVARAVDHATAPDGESRGARTAVVVARPLPYLYLASSVFAERGVPLEPHDSLPLATEPYAAAVDLVLSFASANFDRASTSALLRSPHFVFSDNGAPIGPAAVRSLERRLEDHRYTGGRASLRRLAREWSAHPTRGGRQADARAAVACALALADELAPLEHPAPGSRMLEVLLSFLDRHAAPALAGDVGARETAARRVIRTGLEELQRAARVLQDAEPTTDLAGLTAVVHRWIEGQTAPGNSGSRGVQLLDTEAAPFGRFDAVFLVGLVDGEWPARQGRNIFYPPGMLADLGWPPERARLRASRAAFRDLIGLARERVALSTFALEDDAVVTASTLLDDGAEADLDREVTDVEMIDAAAVHESRLRPSGTASRWLAIRQARQRVPDAAFHGFVRAGARGPYAVSALERYLECPFKYFAQRTLVLEEEAEGARTLTPQQRGLFLHRVFEAFFARWQADGEGAITLANLEPALVRFREVADVELDRLATHDRPVARAWLLGSAASSGLAERLFMTEVEDPAEVVERLLEFRIDGDYELDGGKTRHRIALRGTADRIDLHGDGTFHVIDYKANRPPQAARALQLPVYALCAEQRLSAGRDGDWQATNASYVAFGDPRLRVSVAGRDMAAAMRDGERRLVEAVQSIERGDFPPRPAEIFRCQFCAYPTVCRKDYVGIE